MNNKAVGVVHTKNTAWSTDRQKRARPGWHSMMPLSVQGAYN